MDATERKIAFSYRHDVKDEPAYVTLCGIEADVDTTDLPIACDCGCAQCESPVTCPVCIAVKSGVKN